MSSKNLFIGQEEEKIMSTATAEVLPKEEFPVTAPAKQETALDIQAGTLTPMFLIQIALEKGGEALANLDKLMAMQERWEKNQARKAFEEAFEQFKKNRPEILKNKKADAGGKYTYDYADLFAVTDAVAEALSAVGISHRWRPDTATAPNLIRITCILTHKLGHSVEASLEGPVDTSGGKNGIQAIGSTSTYLSRYTLLLASGCAVKGMDNDGATKSGKKVENLNERLEWIANCRNDEELRKQFNASYDIADKLGDAHAMKQLIEAKNKRYRDLNPKVRGA